MSILEKTSGHPGKTPRFPMSIWKSEVNIGKTNLRYIDWALRKMFIFYGEQVPDTVNAPGFGKTMASMKHDLMKSAA